MEQTEEGDSNSLTLTAKSPESWRRLSIGRSLNVVPLRKHAYSNIVKILPPKNETFQIKNSDIFHISAQNIDCGYSLEPPRRGGSNEYPQSMFLSRNKKNNVYPCKPQFYYIKVGFKGVKIIYACFRDAVEEGSKVNDHNWVNNQMCKRESMQILKFLNNAFNPFNH